MERAEGSFFSRDREGNDATCQSGRAPRSSEGWVGDRREERHAASHVRHPRKQTHVHACVGRRASGKMGAAKANMATHAVAVKTLVFDAGKKNTTSSRTEVGEDGKKVEKNDVKDKRKKTIKRPTPVVETKKDTRAQSRMALLRKSQCRWRTFEPRTRDTHTQTKGRVIVLPEQISVEEEGTQTKDVVGEREAKRTPGTEAEPDVVSAVLEGDRIGPRSLADWLANDPSESVEDGLYHDGDDGWMEQYTDRPEIDASFEVDPSPMQSPKDSSDLQLEQDQLTGVCATGLQSVSSTNQTAPFFNEREELTGESLLADANEALPTADTGKDDLEKPWTPDAGACSPATTGASEETDREGHSQDLAVIQHEPMLASTYQKMADSAANQMPQEEMALSFTHVETIATGMVPDANRTAPLDACTADETNALLMSSVTEGASNFRDIPEAMEVPSSSNHVPLDQSRHATEAVPDQPTIQTTETSHASASKEFQDLTQPDKNPADDLDPFLEPSMPNPSSEAPMEADATSPAVTSPSTTGIVQDQPPQEITAGMDVEGGESTPNAMDMSPSLIHIPSPADSPLEPPTLHPLPLTNVGVDVSTSRAPLEEIRADA